MFWEESVDELRELQRLLFDCDEIVDAVELPGEAGGDIDDIEPHNLENNDDFIEGGVH